MLRELRHTRGGGSESRLEATRNFYLTLAASSSGICDERGPWKALERHRRQGGANKMGFY